MINRLRVWLRALVRRDDVERDMNEEMRLHLAQAVERLMARGMSETDAHIAARREFGNIGVIQEEARDARGVRWIEDVMQDMRFGTRALLKTPAFTVVTLLSLVLGIGVNTAIFTLLKVSIRPGTMDDPASFVYIPGSWSKPALDQLRATTPSLSAVVARSTESVLLAPASASEPPRRTTIDLVSENFFSALHAPITLGRGFGPRDASEPVIVLNHRFWKRRFASDSAILGKTIRLATGAKYTVVGVAGADFTGVRRGGPDFWLPLGLRPTLPGVFQYGGSKAEWMTDARIGWIDVYGRLASGASVRDVKTQMTVALERLAVADTLFAPGISRDPLRIETAESGGINNASERLAAGAVLAATMIVLIVACFNVASLMLARATDRGREIAVRLSLGASRGRIVRQLLTESAVLAIVGAALAVVASAWTVHVIAASGALASVTNGDDPERLTRLLAPDTSVLVFALVLSAVSAIAFGLAPALRASRLDLAQAMKVGPRDVATSRSRSRGGLVIGQVALSLMLLVAAGVLLRSFMRAASLDTGFERVSVLQISVNPRMSGYDDARSAVFMTRLEERLATLPSVRSQAHGSAPIAQRLRARLLTGTLQADGYFNAVSSQFFTTLGISVVRGRAFSEEEVRADASVVVVSEATTRTLWPGRNPLGQIVDVLPLGRARTPATAPSRPRVVVGVARDAQMTDLGQIPPVYAYVPGTSASLLVRAAGDPALASAQIRDAGRAIDANVLVTPTSLDGLGALVNAVLGVRIAATFAGAVGALALLLAAIGIFGLVAYSVSRRTRELGIRRALGAKTSDVIALVLRDGFRIVLIGGGIGVTAGAAASRLLSSLLFGMSPLDPLAFGGVVAVMTVVALLACYIPARRATRIDPLLALKSE